jgi:hypothetical protein
VLIRDVRYISMFSIDSVTLQLLLRHSETMLIVTYLHAK